MFLLAGFSRLAHSIPPDPPTISEFVVTRTWPNGLSELDWWQDGHQQRAVTNIDCAKLAAFTSFQDANAKFDLMIAGSVMSQEEILGLQQSGAADFNGFPKDWPRPLPSLAGLSQYVIGWDGNPASASATLWLDALHRYYDLHRAEIYAAWQLREQQQPFFEAAALQRAQRLLDEAKAPPTQVRVISIEGPPQAPELASPSSGTKK